MQLRAAQLVEAVRVVHVDAKGNVAVFLAMNKALSPFVM